MLLSFLLLAEENCRLINYKQKKTFGLFFQK